MRSRKASFLAATALGVAILAGSTLPSQAQTITGPSQAATVQFPATVQGALPDTVYNGSFGPTMWWPTNLATSGTVPVAPQATSSQPAAFWGCWGGWW